jgi:transcriptional regulator with XRE-family HTH domain
VKAETTIVERIREIIRHEDISVETFSKITGISKYTLDSMFKKETNPSFENLNKIISAYTQYSLDWLITGKGNMLKTNIYSMLDPDTTAVSVPEEPYFVVRNGLQYAELSNGKYRIRAPFIPIKTYAQYCAKYNDNDFLSKLDTVDFVVDKIEDGRKIAFEVKGDSMDDDSKRSICGHDVVLVEELPQNNWPDKLPNDDYPFWIIVLENAIICKQITGYDSKKGEIACHSLNPSPEYADFFLPVEQAFQICNIIAKQSNSF